MMIEYTNNKIIFNPNEIAKTSVEIITKALILYIMKEAHSSLAASSEIFYRENCKSYTDDICCFTNYTTMETSNLLNSVIDKVGGVFFFTILMSLMKGTVDLGMKKISQYRSTQSRI